MSRRFDRTVFRRALDAFGPAFDGQRGKAGVAVGSTLTSTLLDLARPWPAALVIDRILTSTTPADRTDLMLILAAAVATGMISLVVGQLNFIAAVKAAEVGRTATTRVRKMLFEHLNRLALPFHSSSKTGDLLVRLTGDVALIRDLMFTSWLSLLDFTLQIVGLVVIMVLLDPPVILVLIAPFVYMWIQGRRSAGELRKAVRLQRKNQGASAAMAAESLAQIRVIKAYGAENLAVDTFDSSSIREEGEGFKAARIAAGIERRMEIVGGVGSGLVLLVAALRTVSGAITVGDLVVLVSYGKSLFKPLRKISTEVTRLAKASAVTERILEVLDVEPEDHMAGVDASRFGGEISFHKVTFGYKNGRRVLEEADLFIPSGWLVALVGGNGQGKSTSLSLVLRLFEPESGVLTIDGRPIGEFRLDSYRKRMAYVPQDLRLFSGSIADNIRFGRPEASDEEIRYAITQAHFDQVVDRLEDGIDTQLAEGGSTLSGGEARRLMLARAAVRNADVLLLDEPFAGLDPAARPAVARSIRGISDGRTTLVVAHGDLEDLEPDMIVELKDGKLRPVMVKRAAHGLADPA
ncbi:MAG: ABC transporter ATP-binding protein [Acidimicrobiia bacterium]